MQPTHDPTETFLETLITGDKNRLLADFAVEPAIDDPLGGSSATSPPSIVSTSSARPGCSRAMPV